VVPRVLGTTPSTLGAQKVWVSCTSTDVTTPCQGIPGTRYQGPTILPSPQPALQTVAKHAHHLSPEHTDTAWPPPLSLTQHRSRGVVHFILLWQTGYLNARGAVDHAQEEDSEKHYALLAGRGREQQRWPPPNRRHTMFDCDRELGVHPRIRKGRRGDCPQCPLCLSFKVIDCHGSIQDWLICF